MDSRMHTKIVLVNRQKVFDFDSLEYELFLEK